MARLSRARLAVVLWTLAFLCGATAVGAQSGSQPASADPLSVIPADSLVCLRINNLAGTLGKIDQFAAGVSPIPVSVSALVPMQLAKFLGGTEPKGINMAGSFAIFWPLPGGDTPNPQRLGVLVPVSDYKQFTQGNANVIPPDAQGIAAIGPKEQPMLVATDVSGFALVTPSANRQALIETKKLMSGAGAAALAKRLSPDEQKRAQNAPLWVYANIQTVSKMFGPAIQAKLQEAKKMVEQMQPGQGAAMDMNAGMLNTLMQELQSASLTLDPTATAIRAGFVATAMPNTPTAKTLQGSPRTLDKKFMAYLENGAIMNMIMSIDPATWIAINDFYFNMMGKAAGKIASDEEIAKLKKWSTEATNALTGTVALSFSADTKSKPPFRAQYAAGLKDAQAFNRALDQVPAMFDSGLMADFMKETGATVKFELKRKVETYKDVPVDAMHIAINPTDPNSDQSKMLTAMLGQGIDIRLAVVNNLLVYAIGSDPTAGVHKLIDQAKGGAQTVPSEVQTAMQLIPGSEKGNFFATYNYLRAFPMITAIMPVPLPQISAQSQSDIALAGKMTGGNLNVDMALPKQHLIEIVSAFMQLQQQMQQQQQPQDQEKKPETQAQPQSKSPGKM